jgi:osmoprotectant transport system ATP-binding protein
MLRLTNVSRSFAGKVVLQSTTLTVSPGRTTVLIGPSGHGKSTLLRLMIGLLQPDTGTVRFDGQELTAANVLRLRHRMGYVLQDGGLFPHLTARDNVILLARHLGWSPQRINDRAQELAALTRFPADGLDRYPAQLSGGQRQRVGLMRALMLDPTVILLDEPLGALDPMLRFELQEDLKAIFLSLRKTVVLVTHDLAEAAFFGDEVVLLAEGRIVQRGRLDELALSPSEPLVTLFLRAHRLPLPTGEEKTHENKRSLCVARRPPFRWSGESSEG